MLAWLVKDKAITPHIPVFDRSRRDDGTLSHGPTSPSMLSTMFMCVPKVSCSEPPAGFMTAGRCSIGHKRQNAICVRSN
jgi:hypothetical protein